VNGDNREESLEGFELRADTLRNAVILSLYDAQDRREGEGAQGDQALEGIKVTGRGLRGLDVDWEEKREVVNAFRIDREARMLVYWHSYVKWWSDVQ
jgi:hypothetical protein